MRVIGCLSYGHEAYSNEYPVQGNRRCLNGSTPQRSSSASSLAPPLRWSRSWWESSRISRPARLRDHRDGTRQHPANLEQCFTLLGEEVDNSPCAVSRR